MTGKVATIMLAFFCEVARPVIFLLLVVIVVRGEASPQFALIGLGGLSLAFLRAGRPILSQGIIFRILPGLVLTVTVCFVMGFSDLTSGFNDEICVIAWDAGLGLVREVFEFQPIN
jgi:hypothetical protein